MNMTVTRSAQIDRPLPFVARKLTARALLTMPHARDEMMPRGAHAVAVTEGTRVVGFALLVGTDIHRFDFSRLNRRREDSVGWRPLMHQYRWGAWPGLLSQLGISNSI